MRVDEVFKPLHEQQRSETLVEAVNKKPIKLYHGTDSAGFQKFAPSKAVKGQQYWNPLGTGLYASNSAEMAASFGKNVYEIIIPPGYSYKRFNDQTWMSTGISIALRSLSLALRDEFKVKIKVGDLNDLGYALREIFGPDRESQIIRGIYQGIQQSGSPYEGLTECMEIVFLWAGEDVAARWKDHTEQYADKKLGKFDFVIFHQTNWPYFVYDEKGKKISPVEVVIYNPELQKTGEPVQVRRY